MSVLEDVRDHLTAVVAQHDVDKAAAQVKLDAVNAEIAKPVPAPTLDDLKALTPFAGWAGLAKSPDGGITSATGPI